MDYDKLYGICKDIYPTCHNDWAGLEQVPNYPYIAIVDEKSDNFGADDKVYFKNENYFVELYSAKKDYLTAEKALEQAFDDNEIFWNKERIRLKDLEVFQTVYFI